MNRDTKEMFQAAKACFGENVAQHSKRLPDPDLKAIMWNLNKGLHDLSQAIEMSLDELHSHLDHMQSRK